MPPVTDAYNGSGQRLAWAPMPPGAGARLDIIPGNQPATATTDSPTTSWDSYYSDDYTDISGQACPSLPAAWALGLYSAGGTLVALAVGLRKLVKWWRKGSSAANHAPPASSITNISVTPVVGAPPTNIAGTGHTSRGCPSSSTTANLID